MGIIVFAQKSITVVIYFMPLNHPKSGVNYIAEFQTSPIPWITSSAVPTGSSMHVAFDRVTKWVSIKNNTSASVVAVGVTQNGLEKTHNYFPLNGGETVQLDWRLIHLWLSASVGAPNVSIYAGMTGINRQESDVLEYLSSSISASGVG